MLELDPDKRGLNINIMSMFNALWRVSMLEGLLDSKTLLEDFSDLDSSWNVGDSWEIPQRSLRVLH